jgi:radical SAM protein with 4Fe4S-binding SPASM domain
MKKTNLFSKHFKFENQKYIFDSLSQNVFSELEDEKILEKNFLLEGQEKEAVYNRIFKKPIGFSAYVLPTLNCSLRCPYCYVLHSLKKEKDLPIFDNAAFESFSKRWIKKYNEKKFTFSILGGEPLLNVEYCLGLIGSLKKLKEEQGISYTIDMTSNLTFEKMRDKYIELFDNADSIGVSIDGYEENHNNQRKTFISDFNAFRRTIKNLHSVIQAGFSDKIKIKATVLFSEIDKNKLEEFVHLLLCLGINKKNISIKNISVTKMNKRSNLSSFSFLELRSTPCCAFRYMQNFSLYHDKLYGNYFDVCENTLIGSLNDSVEEIENNFRKHILKEMPCLQDEICMSCPALGVCWGQCINDKVITGNKPSQFCHKEEIIDLFDTELNRKSNRTDYFSKSIEPLINDYKKNKLCRSSL